MWSWLTEAVLDKYNSFPKYREKAKSRSELQRGGTEIRPHNQCEYKPVEKWSVLGQMLQAPCEEEKNEEEKKQEEEKREEEKTQDEVLSGERSVFIQRVEAHVMKTVEFIC